MKETLMKYDDFNVFNVKNTLKIKNYTSFDIYKIKELLNSLDKNYFAWIKLNEGSLIESALYDYYGDENLYDLIMFINQRDMLFDMPYSYDVILNAIDRSISEYEYRVFGNFKKELSEKSNKRLREKLDADYTEKNQKFLYLKVIKREYINEVKRRVYEEIETQKEMYSMIEV
jgi:hypothetical protein